MLMPRYCCAAALQPRRKSAAQGCSDRGVTSCATARRQDFDFGKGKAFPFRDQHFFSSIDKAKADLGWAPKFDLLAGLTDSYQKDFGRGTFREAADFTCDDMILAKVKSS